MLTKEDTGFIKGIAVLLLLFHHNPNADWDLLSIRSAARICVWCFMFVSSYGFAVQMEKVTSQRRLSFIVKRLALLYCPMWIIYLIRLLALFLAYPSSVVSFITSAWYNLPSDILCISQYWKNAGAAGYWYVGLLALIITVYPLIFLIVRKTGWLSLVLLYAFIVLFPFKLSLLYGGYVDEFLLIVFIGTLFRQKKIYERLPRVSGVKAVLVALAACLILIALAPIRTYFLDEVANNVFFRIDFMSTIMTVILVTAVYMARSGVRLSHVVEWLGKQSGNIYFSHSIFYFVILRKITIRSGLLSFLLCLMFSLAVTAAVEYVKKKTGYNERLRKALERV